MQAGRRTIAGMAAFLLLIACLGGLWRVLVANTEMRLTGETLSNYARDHPPKPWRGFEIAILNVAVKGEVHIKAHLSGYLIHTPVEISAALNMMRRRARYSSMYRGPSCRKMRRARCSAGSTRC